MKKILTILTPILVFAAGSVALAQQNYKSPEAAVDALVTTAKSGDMKAALEVLGRDGEDIISSGDKVSDDAVRARFVASYDAKHQIAMEGAKKAILIIGDNDYPFPIPLEKNKDGTWSFDTQAGREEILARRIGHNELDAIQTSLAYVDAQNDYAAKDRGVGAGDVVAFQLPNWMEAAATFWAAALLGAALVPIVHFYGRKELAHILSSAKPRVFITTDEFARMSYQPDLCSGIPVVGLVGRDFDGLLADEPMAGTIAADSAGPALIAFAFAVVIRQADRHSGVEIVTRRHCLRLSSGPVSAGSAVQRWFVKVSILPTSITLS